MPPAPSASQRMCGVGCLSETPLESQGTPAQVPWQHWACVSRPMGAKPQGDFPAQCQDAISPVPQCPSSGWEQDTQSSLCARRRASLLLRHVC